MTQYTVNVNWDRIHAAARAVDVAGSQSSLPRMCYGTYFASSYEDLGVAGLANLTRLALDYRSLVWGAIHGASDGYKRALESVPACAPRAYRERRTAYEARYQARSNGLRRVESVIQNARANVRIAIALDHLFTVLWDSGIVEYNPNTEICGINRGTVARPASVARLNVCGLYWLAGRQYEPDLAIPLAYAQAFADHGLDALHAAVWCG